MREEKSGKRSHKVTSGSERVVYKSANWWSARASATERVTGRFEAASGPRTKKKKRKTKKKKRLKQRKTERKRKRKGGRGAHTIEDNAVAIFEPAKYLDARCCSVLSALALLRSFFGPVHVPPKRSDSAPMTHGPDQTGGQKERKRGKEREREATRRAGEGARERRV